MKKLFLGLALLTFTVATNAQDGFSKGSKFLSGTLGFSSVDDKEGSDDGTIEAGKTNSFSFSPSVGYFLSNNLAVGISVSVGSKKFTADGDSDPSEEKSSFGVGGFGRYYFSPKSKFSMFGHLGLNYNSMNDKVNEYKTTGIEAFVAPGLNYWVSNKLALEAVIGKIGYSTSKPDYSGAESSSSFNFGINLSSVSFGMVYKF